jgi:hypothetical protein
MATKPFVVWRRENGLFYVTVRLPNGKKKYRSLGVKDKQAALVQLSKLFPQFSNPSIVVPLKEQESVSTIPTLSEFASKLEIFHSSVRPATLNCYRYAVELFIKIVGDRELGKYHQMDIENFKATRSSQVSKIYPNLSKFSS